MTPPDQSPLCIIIGAGPGVSAAVARRFAKGGFRLALIARAIDDAAPFVVDLRAQGADVLVRAADVADFAGLAAVLQALIVYHAPIGVLVYNAAGVTPANPTALPPDRLMADLAVSVGGALVAAQTLAPAMAAGQGTMLFTGGGFALYPEPALASLGVGKAALRNLVQSLAQELFAWSIRVGTVTIKGKVEPGTAYDPDRIADAFMALHTDRDDQLGFEYSFAG